jgi:hypothetical protein
MRRRSRSISEFTLPVSMTPQLGSGVSLQTVPSMRRRSRRDSAQIDRKPESLLERVRDGAFAGLAFAAFGLLVGLARIGFALLGGSHFHFAARDAVVSLSYPVAFMLAGIGVGALYPLRQYRLGALLLGLLGFAIFFAVILLSMDGWFSRWPRADWFVLCIGALTMGPIAGYSFCKRRPPAA